MTSKGGAVRLVIFSLDQVSKEAPSSYDSQLLLKDPNLRILFSFYTYSRDASCHSSNVSAFLELFKMVRDELTSILAGRSVVISTTDQSLII